jgi:mono/diheme cytochrome c family protein/glucose/arabinose dehydrogenase
VQRRGFTRTGRAGAVVTAALGAALLSAGVAARHAATAQAAAPQSATPQATGQASQSAAPPLAPDAALKTFHLPPGYRLELVASEPLVADPVWMDMDPDGRLWVVEMRGYMPTFDGKGEDAPVGQVVVLEDTDNDGRADKRTVFLDGLVQPRTIKVLEHGVLVIAPPQLILATDTNGDLKADTREVLRSDVGVKGANPEHSPNSLLWALDNWLYTSEYATDYRWTRGGLESARTLARGQWGISMDDTGRIYRNWNDDPLHVDYAPGRALARNPSAVRTRGVYEPVTTDLEVWAARPTPAVNRGYRDGVLRADGSLATFQAAGTPTVYRGDRLPPDMRGNVFVTEPSGNLVRRYVIKEGADGRLTATNAHPKGEFLTSTDERFRPVNLFSAADGTLYIADMYRGVIQHLQYQSEYLKNQIRARGLVEPIGLGRIYRVVHETTRRAERPALSAKTPAQLVPMLAHANGWYRDTAQRLLVERGDASVAPALSALVTGAPDARTRLHALSTLDGLGAVDAAIVQRALRDADPAVRAAAIRVAEPWLAKPGDPLAAAVWRLAADRAPRVQWQLALSLAAFPTAARVEHAARLLGSHGRDPFVVDGVVSSLTGLEHQALARLLARPGASDDALGVLAGAVARAGDPAAVADLWTRIADARRPVGERLALARGTELALGTESFGVRTARRLTLKAAPQPLLGRAHEGGEIDAVVARVLDGMDWPGKPRRAAAVAPLTAEEQQRFEAGKEIYNRLCIACHQADGRGREGLAPALAGSPFVTGRAGIMARIVIHGKEGKAMMPPLGTLSDAEIAGVLTFVRRSFGHTASPVDVELVREVRGSALGRDRPWSELELRAISQPDGDPRTLRRSP